MKKFTCLLFTLGLALVANAQTAFFTPVKTVALRAPSVPLFTSDPYFQVWQNSDNLTDRVSSHWDGSDKAMLGFVRVDGKAYQFMGTAFQPTFNQDKVILPASWYTQTPWTAQVMVFQGDQYNADTYKAGTIIGTPPADGAGRQWYDPAYSLTSGTSSWSEQTAPFSSDANVNNMTAYQWAKVGVTGDIYFRRTFTLDKPFTGEVFMAYGHDDAPVEIYFNGTLVEKIDDANPDWDNAARRPLTAAEKALLKTDGSENVVAVHVHQDWGGAFADFGLYEGAVTSVKSLLGDLNTTGTWDCKYMLPENNDVMNSMNPEEWGAPGYDDSEWESAPGPFGNVYYPEGATYWNSDATPILIRRHVTLNAAQLSDIKANKVTMEVSFDENPVIYVNGSKIWSASGWNDDRYESYTFSDEDKALFHEGDNVIACQVAQGAGGGHIDFGIGYQVDEVAATAEQATQNGLAQVLPTNTYYKFTAGPVDLNLVFTSTQVMKDLDAFSTPINYVSYEAKSNDGKSHNVQVYLGAYGHLASLATGSTVASAETVDGMQFVKAGTSTQSISGDRRATAGYIYMMADPARNQSATIGMGIPTLSSVISSGELPAASGEISGGGGQTNQPLLVVKDDLGEGTDLTGYTVLGYDYAGKAIHNNVGDVDYDSYSAKNGAFTAQMANYGKAYETKMQNCRDFDQKVYEDAEKAGGQKFAELASLAYRQTAAATRVVADTLGNPLAYNCGVGYWTKMNPAENYYSLAPLFGSYNPELLKLSLAAFFQYVEKDNQIQNLNGCAPHTEGNFARLEGWESNNKFESTANIVTAAAVAAKVGVDKDFLSAHYNTIKGYADALEAYLNDPDKMQGELSLEDEGIGDAEYGDNQNLRAKAIIAVGGFALLAEKVGQAEDAETYGEYAGEQATTWLEDNNMDDFYLQSTKVDWAQNFVFAYDKFFGTSLFSDAIETSVNWYKEQIANPDVMGTYGLPVDAVNLEKALLGETLMTASLTESVEDFQLFSDPIWKYANETKTRMPLITTYNVKTGLGAGKNADACSFAANPFAGLLWSKVLMMYQDGELDGIQSVETGTKGVKLGQKKVYNLNGQYLGTSVRGLKKGVYIVGGQKVVIK